MFIDVSTAKTKKIPRILLSSIKSTRIPLKNLSLMWPDRSRSDVYDLSLAGALISSQGQLTLRKPGQQFEVRLDLDDKGNSVFLKARIEGVSGDSIGLVFEALSAAHRLVIEQNVKDRILIQNLRAMSESVIGLSGAQWFHGPFDTNIFLWQESPGFSLEKAIVEYDNLLWFFEEGRPVQVLKSGAATDAAKSYLHLPELSRLTAKSLMGASWLDRLIKCLDVVIEGGYLPEHSDSFRILQQTLKANSK